MSQAPSNCPSNGGGLVWDGGPTERGEGVLGREDAQPMEEEGCQDPEDRHEELPGEGRGKLAALGALCSIMTYSITVSKYCGVASRPTLHTTPASSFPIFIKSIRQMRSAPPPKKMHPSLEGAIGATE